MSGNEILYNMTNYKYFRNTEIINSIYEFSRRLELPENKQEKSLNNYNWLNHGYFAPMFKELVWRIPRLNVKKN